MINRPQGHELLSVGRRVLLDELLPLLPTDRTYDVLMIANAMGIAGRQLETLGGREQEPDPAIAGFYQAAGLVDAGPATERRLAELIRSRAIPRDSQSRTHALLLSLTHARLAISNPKYLRRSNPEGADDDK